MTSNKNPRARTRNDNQRKPVVVKRISFGSSSPKRRAK